MKNKTNKEKVKQQGFSHEYVKQKFLEQGIILEKNNIYERNSQKLLAKTEEGYKVYVTYQSNINRGSKPMPFYKFNSFTIWNIRNVWLPKNAPDYELLSERFDGSHEPLIWQLKDSHNPPFQMCWANFQTGYRDPKLTWQNVSKKKRMAIEQVLKAISEILNKDIYDGWTITKDEISKYKNAHTILKFTHKEGFMTATSFDVLKKMTKGFLLLDKRKVNSSTNNMYILVSKKTPFTMLPNQIYVGNAEYYKFICSKHGEFVSILHNVLTRGKGCVECDKERRIGETNPRFNPNLSQQEREEKRFTSTYKDWRASVYDRDNNICQICGVIGHNLNAHHLDGYDWCKNKREDIDNGITLCNNCHNEGKFSFHNIYGKGGNTKIEFIKWIQEYHLDKQTAQKTLQRLLDETSNGNIQSPSTEKRRKEFAIIKNGEIEHKYFSVTRASKELGMARSNIYACLNKRQKTSKGYTIIYLDEL